MLCNLKMLRFGALLCCRCGIATHGVVMLSHLSFCLGPRWLAVPRDRPSQGQEHMSSDQTPGSQLNHINTDPPTATTTATAYSPPSYRIYQISGTTYSLDTHVSDQASPPNYFISPTVTYLDLQLRRPSSPELTRKPNYQPTSPPLSQKHRTIFIDTTFDLCDAKNHPAQSISASP